MAVSQIIERQWAKLRDRDWPVVCFLVALPFVFFWRATLGRATLGDKDAVFWFFPAYKLVAAELKAGRLPLWNPLQYSGTPLFAEWQAGVLDPLNWIYLIETTSRTLTLSLELTFAVALLATFSYTRSLGFTRRAAVVAAIIYALSGFAVGRVLYPGFLHIVALTPLVLCCTERLYQRGRWRDVGYGALVIAWQLFAAHPQPLLYSSLLASAYALCKLRMADFKVWTNSPTLPLSEVFTVPLRFLLQFAAMFIAGASLAAVQLIPAAELARQSVRQEWPFALFTINSLHPASLLTLLFPFWHGEGRGIYRMGYWGVYWHHNEAQIYVGVLALSLALAGAWLGWRARQRVMIFWSIAAIVGALLAFGQYVAPLARLLYQIPLLNQFRSPNRHWMEVTLAVAVLAGYAVDRLLRAKVAQTEVCATTSAQMNWLARRVVIVAAALTTLCCAVGGLALWQRDWVERALRAVMDLSYWPAGFLRAASAEFYLPMIFALGACVLLFLFVRAPQQPWRYGLLVGWLLIDFHLYALFAPISTPVRLEPYIGRAVPESLAAQQSERAPFRYQLMLNPAAGEFNPFWFYGHETATGYDPLLNERYKTFSGIDEGGRAFIPTLLEAHDHTFDLLNVRYVFVPPSFFAPRVDQTDALADAPAELSRGKRAVFAVADEAGDTLAVVSNLANAAELANGAAVAEITVSCATGARWTTELRAGRDTAEWAYDRADVRGIVKHARAPLAESWAGDAAASFQAHAYLARLRLPPGLIACRANRLVQIAARANGGIALSVRRVVLEDSASGRTTRLAQMSAAALSDATRWRELPVRSTADPYLNFRIYENLRALPRVWLVARVKVAYEGDQLKTIRGELAEAHDFDPRTTALVDHETAAQLPQALLNDAAAPAPSGQVQIISRQPTRLVIEAETERPSLLVLSEIFYPGWRAQVDGKDAAIRRVNYDLRAVELSAGKQRVELVYAPASIKIGAVVSLTTALCLLLVVVWEKRRARRITDVAVAA